MSLRATVVANDYGQKIDVIIAQAIDKHEFEAKLQLELMGVLQNGCSVRFDNKHGAGI